MQFKFGGWLTCTATHGGGDAMFAILRTAYLVICKGGVHPFRKARRQKEKKKTQIAVQDTDTYSLDV